MTNPTRAAGEQHDDLSNSGGGDPPPAKKKLNIASGMAIVYGFLASIILTEYLKVASKAVHAGPVYPFLALVMLASFYLFYQIFDTLVWLILYDKNPVTDLPKVDRPRVEAGLWMLCRCTEFVILIWLYDFVNVLDKASGERPQSDLMPHLARLCLDIGIVWFGWAVWFALLGLTEFAGKFKSSDADTAAQRREKARLHQIRVENDRQLICHVVFGGFFAALWFWFNSENRPAPWLAFALAYGLTIVSILRVYVVQKTYYSENFHLYWA
jgi:hypothetical protein